MPPLTRRAWLVEIACSCLVYAVPLASAHWLRPVGELLLRGSMRATEHASSWAAADWGVVLTAQAFVLAVLRGSRRLRRPIRVALCAGALAAVTPALNLALMVWIPSRYLIEDDTAAERNSLAETCHAEGVDVVATAPSVYPQSDAPVLVIRRAGEGRFGILRIPSCEIQDFDVPVERTTAIASAAGTLLWTHASPDGGESDWFLTDGDGSTTRVGRFAAAVTPSLLDDGLTVTWPERSQGAIVVAEKSGATTRIDTAGIPAGSRERVEGAGPAGPFRLAVLGGGRPQWLTIDRSGSVTRTITMPDSVSLSAYLHPTPRGWVAWDRYVEDGRYAVAWMVDGKTFKRELPRGLGLTQVAVDADGRYIAVSATSGLNIGRQRDQVWLIRTSDGVELFRRYAPKYSRDVVALPAAKYFAVSQLVAGRPTVRIYSLP